MIFNLFRKKERIKKGLELKLYTDANVFGENGTLNVTHVRKGLVQEDVIFVFPGITIPPVLTLELMEFIYDAAAKQGYIVHHLSSYGKVNNFVAPRRPEPAVLIGSGSGGEAIGDADLLMGGEALAGQQFNPAAVSAAGQGGAGGNVTPFPPITSSAAGSVTHRSSNTGTSV